MMNYCGRCERQLCVDCQSMKYCTKCGGFYCVDCKDFIDCSGCNRNYRCKECTPNDWGFCCKCESHFCNDCWSGGTHMAVKSFVVTTVCRSMVGLLAADVNIINSVTIATRSKT